MLEQTSNKFCYTIFFLFIDALCAGVTCWAIKHSATQTMHENIPRSNSRNIYLRILNSTLDMNDFIRLRIK